MTANIWGPFAERYATPKPKLHWPTGEDKPMLVSVGAGEAPTPGAAILEPETNIASTLKALPSALMDAASVDQDINCRVVFRN